MEHMAWHLDRVLLTPGVSLQGTLPPIVHCVGPDTEDSTWHWYTGLPSRQLSEVFAAKFALRGAQWMPSGLVTRQFRFAVPSLPPIVRTSPPDSPPSAVSAATLLPPNQTSTSPATPQRKPAIDDPGFDPNSHYTRYRQYYERGTTSPQRDFLWPSQKSVVHDVQLGRPRRFRRLLARLAITSLQGRPQPSHRIAIDRVADFRRFRQAIRRPISSGVFSDPAPRLRADHPHPDSRHPCLNAARSPAITTPLHPSDHGSRCRRRPHHVFPSTSDSSNAFSTVAWNVRPAAEHVDVHDVRDERSSDARPKRDGGQLATVRHDARHVDD